MNLDKFAENMRVLMARKNINQRQLARDSGLGESRVNSYYHGEKEPSLSALVSLILALGCTFEELVGMPPTAKVKPENATLTDNEVEMLRAYRSADARTMQVVRLLLLGKLGQ